MIKYLYVLTSSGVDYYYEQFLLSVTSLKRVMPDAYVTLLTDDKTEKTLIGKRAGFRSLINEFKTIDFPEELSMAQRSRHLKTTMRKHIAGDFLFLDCDTIITDDLSEIQNTRIQNIGAVLNGHNLLSQTWNKIFYYECDKNYMLSCTKCDKIYNSGVLFCRDNSAVHSFFAEWHKCWEFLSSNAGFFYDQPSLNHVNCLSDGIIKELDGMWNCQVGLEGFLKCLHNAKIIHYINSGREIYLLGTNKELQSIKDTGNISDEIMKKLENPYFLIDATARLFTYNNYLRQQKDLKGLQNTIDQYKSLNINSISLKKAIKIITKRIAKRIINL